MIQRIKRVALLALTTMILATAFTAGASAARVTATKKAVVRTSASVNSAKKTVMKKSMNRKVLGYSADGKWLKVKVNGKTGYVHHNRMKFGSGARSLGNFKLTFYGGDTITASGRTPRLNHTIAVDPRVISLGSKVYIDGYGVYYAEDTGGAIKNKIIDIFVRSEAEANRIGIDYASVYVIQ